MIAYLKGTVAFVDFEKIIVDVNGVGYGVSLTVRSAAQLSKDMTIQLYISEIVREQSYDLYGFLSEDEQDLFELLVKVNGVGPRLALAILGLGSGADIAAAVSGEDDRFFSRAPGVGKKLAERLLIELRDKVTGTQYSSHLGASGATSSNPDALQALVALGFSSEDARAMLQGVDPDISVEQQITAALKNK